MQRIFMLVIKLAAVGVAVAGLIAPISASAGSAPHSCSSISPERTGGISEMASCGKSGVTGNRAQFVRAITRPVENRYSLSQRRRITAGQAEVRQSQTQYGGR